MEKECRKFVKYRRVKCCPNCKHLYWLQDWESNPEFFCTFVDPVRPSSGVEAMGQTELKNYDIKKWATWASKTRVEEDFVCDNHKWLGAK